MQQFGVQEDKECVQKRPEGKSVNKCRATRKACRVAQSTEGMKECRHGLLQKEKRDRKCMEKPLEVKRNRKERMGGCWNEDKREVK